MYIGVDIGGSKIRAGLLSTRFVIKDILERPTQARKGKQAVLENIRLAIQGLYNKKVQGIGVAIRGQVDYKNGMLKESTMMPDKFRGVRLAEYLQEQFQKPVRIENDTNCFTLAEARFGAGYSKKHVVGITLGTGIGGGIVINGKIYRGFGGAAEFGHMVIDPYSYKWNTGQRGPWESLCSATAAVKLYKLKTNRTTNAREIEELFNKRERGAREVFRDMSEYLSIGFANIIHIFNPDVIVVGGGYGKLKFYVDPAIKQTPKRLVYPAHKKTKIKYAKLGPHAGLIGAAMLVKK